MKRRIPQVRWKKRTYRSKFFKIMRKMLKKSGKSAYRSAVKKAIRKWIGEGDTYRRIQDFFELLHKWGFKKLMRKLFMKNEESKSRKNDLQRVSSNEIKNEANEIKESNNPTDLEEVKEFRDIGEGTLTERMSNLLSCGLKPVSFKEA